MNCFCEMVDRRKNVKPHLRSRTLSGFLTFTTLDDNSAVVMATTPGATTAISGFRQTLKIRKNQQNGG